MRGYGAILMLGLLFWGAGVSVYASGVDDESYAGPRTAMVAEIVADYKVVGESLGNKTLNPIVLEAMRTVPRHEFVPETLRRYAYENRPLPIGQGQTISQPFIVGIMTDLLGINSESVVLELGTATGYQTAVLALCAKQVYTMEIIPELADEAKVRLNRLHYWNVEVRTGDGYYGWPEHAPFDAIMVTAAAPEIPPPLIAQLKPGGKMVIPVGPPRSTQYLQVVEKDLEGKVRSRQLLPVAFVPLTGDH